MIWLIVLLLGVLLPDPAAAMPSVVTAISVGLAALSGGAGFGAALAAGFGALSTFASAVLKGFALTLVGQLFAKKAPSINDAGIQTEQTTTGDVTPQKFVVGTYGLEGHAVAPAYSRSKSNNVLTYILEVSNIPVEGLTGRIMIDGQWADILDTAPLARDAPTSFALDGFREEGKADHAWLWFQDGRQTAAHPKLVEEYGDHPTRPWTEAHVLRGSAYAVLEFQRDPDFFPGLPAVRFEVRGIRLYDPRKDSSVGGDGPQRWDDPGTWEWTENPQVINYNIFRGITLSTGDIYGGGSEAEDLPLDSWFAAMNECDRLIGGRKQYVAGFEINTGEMEPAEVIEEMNRASFAQVSEFGGVWRVRVGAPAAPVMMLSDDDFMITESSVSELFPGLQDTFNAATGNYVEPEDAWQPREAEAVLNPEWEAADRNRRLPRNIGLPAVSNPSQAQHLLQSYIKDSRRFRVHSMTLPPAFSRLDLLDTISWTSTENGYSSKLFEVVELEDRPSNLQQRVKVREREPGDLDWSSDQDLPTPISRLGTPRPAPALPDISLTPIEIRDSDGVPRRAVLLLEWADDVPADAIMLQFEVRILPSLEVIQRGVVRSSDLAVEINFVLPANAYEVRARYIMSAPSDWTQWLSAVTSDLRLVRSDFSDAINAEIDAALVTGNQAIADAAAAAAQATAAQQRHAANLGEDSVPDSVAELLEHVRSGLGNLTNLPTQVSAPDVPEPPLGTLSDRFEFEVPEIRSVSQSVARIESSLAELELARFFDRKRMTDAGIYVEPESGVVRISGVEATRTRQSEVEARFDAIESEFSLKASLKQVNDAIAAASLPEAQLEALNDLQARVSDVEITASAQDESIDLITTTLEVEGQLVTMSSVTARLDNAESELALRVTNDEFSDLSARTTDVELTLSGLDVPGFQFAVSDQRQLRESAVETQNQTVGGLLKSWLDARADRVAQADARMGLTAFVNEQLESEATQRLELAATIEGDIGKIAGRVDTIETTKVDKDGAVAAINSVVDATFGEFSTFAEFTMWAEANESGANSGFRWDLDNTNVLFAQKVTSDGTVDGTTKVRISGDAISLNGNTDVKGDFFVSGSTVLLDANTIVDGGFQVSGGNVVLDAFTIVNNNFQVRGGSVLLDANTIVQGDFSVSGGNVVLDGDTTVLGDFQVLGDMIAPGAVSDFVDDNFFSPVSTIIPVGAAGNGGVVFSGSVATPGSFGTAQGLITTIVRGRLPGVGWTGKNGEFRVQLRFDGATFATYTGMIFDGELQMRETSVRGAGGIVSNWELQVNVFDAPDDIEILSRGFLVWQIKK